MQIKPMRTIDVRHHNSLLSQYLKQCGPSGFGCKTQIRMEFLRSDGFHINPMYDSVLDRTYACALLGVEVPCPTPESNFIPDDVRRSYEKNWPRLVGNDWGRGS